MLCLISVYAGGCARDKTRMLVHATRSLVRLFVRSRARLIPNETFCIRQIGVVHFANSAEYTINLHTQSGCPAENWRQFMMTNHDNNNKSVFCQMRMYYYYYYYYMSVLLLLVLAVNVSPIKPSMQCFLVLLLRVYFGRVANFFCYSSFLFSI